MAPRGLRSWRRREGRGDKGNMRIAAQTPGRKVEFTLGPWLGGIDEKTEPGMLGAGQLHDAFNVLFDETTGLVVKHWGNTVVAALPSGNPPKFGYVFKKDDGSEYLILSDGEYIWSTTDLITFTPLNTDALGDTAYLQFETAENKCWIGNGIDFEMWFDGTNFVIMDREYGNAEAAAGDAGTDATHIIDADLTSAVTDYWKNRKVVITSGAAAGGEATVTAFDPATDKLTISPALTGLTTGDGYMVGLIMPKARIKRFGLSTLFLGGTTENQSEVRFNRLDDPDTGLKMSLDNPRAWPANYQLSITQDDGDQLWTFSPCYRNRILVTKGSAIYRLEPDSVYQYAPVLVSQEVGCRYPDSWAVKDDLLHFMGNERSGLADLYVTDMVSVKPRHKDGRLLPSFQVPARAGAAYKYISRASADQFDTGEKSTLCKTGNGRLECREIATKTDWDEIIVAGTKTSVNVSEITDSITIDGLPVWTQRYECNELPAAASPVWTKYMIGNYLNGSPIESIVSGELLTAVGATGGGRGTICYFRDNVFDASKNTYAAFKVKMEHSGWIVIIVQNGTKQIKVKLNHAVGTFALYINDGYIQAIDADVYEVLHILLDKDGAGSVYIDGVSVWTGAAIAAEASTEDNGYGTGWAANSIVYSATGQSPVTQYLDFIYEDADFLYTAAQLPATLPATGSAIVKIDYLRKPDAFGKYFYTSVLNGGTVGVETQSSADDATYNSLVALTNGQQPGVDNATAVLRYLKLKFTLTRADLVNGPELQKLIGGFLWRMKAAPVSSNISAWRKYQDEITKPAGTVLGSQIRLAKTLVTPIEANWAAWEEIVTGENIGTILADSPPPAAGEGRWLDVKVEGGPSASGVSPNLENFLLNWQEGLAAAGGLVISAFIHKRRLYLTGISTEAVANDMIFVLDTKQAWSKFIGQSLNRQVAFKGVIYGLSSIDANIYQQEVEGKYSDGSTAIDAYIDTGALDFGNQRFEIRNVKVGSGGIISNVEVLLSYDGTTYTSMGTLAFTAEGTQNLRIPRGRTGKRHFIRLRVAAAEGMAVSMLKIAGVVKAEQ